MPTERRVAARWARHAAGVRVEVAEHGAAVAVRERIGWHRARIAATDAALDEWRFIDNEAAGVGFNQRSECL